MRILITGGAGFIGSHLADNMLDRGHSVVAIDDLSKGSVANIEHLSEKSAFTFVRADVRDRSALLEAARGAEVIVHLAAAKIPRYDSALWTITTNLDGTRAALDAAHTNKAKFVLASTSDVYGRSPAPRFAEDGDLVLGPSTSRRWSYAATKLCDEHLTLAYKEEFGLRVSILRLFGTYGPRQYLNWWGGPQGVFLEAITRGHPIEVHGDGTQTRCFIYVTDLVEGIARAAERDAANGEILNLGRDEEISISQLARLMFAIANDSGEPQIQYIPYESFGGNYQDVLRRVPDLTKMLRVLDFESSVSLREGLERLWAWYRTRTPRK